MSPAATTKAAPTKAPEFDRYRLRAGDGAGLPARLPKGRYLEEEFAALERRRLWPATWQLACLTTDVAEPGDWCEYRIGDQSYLVVRDHDGELRAFHNACRHRGFRLCEGKGHADELRCGFHDWCYGLDGSLREVVYRKNFGVIANDDLSLAPVRLGVWHQMVFINPTPDGPDLEEFLDPVPSTLAPFKLDERTLTASWTIPLAGNWKTTVDAFNEAYHVEGLHPGLRGFMDALNTTYELWDRGHSMMKIPLGVGSPRFPDADQAQVAQAFVDNYSSMLGMAPGDHPDLDGRSARDWAVDKVRGRAAAEGVDFTHYNDEQILDDYHYLVFPNVVLNVHSDLFTIFRARPGDHPGRSHFDFWLFHRLGSHNGAGPPPEMIEFPEGTVIAEVVNQDLDGIGRVQAGMASDGIDELVLGDFDCRLVNMHAELDRVLAHPVSS
ncbi:aromatic ring-hydroxylating oxygenase subunit alpha [Candidatus Poriferisocius sp.]|uniref:aromatic ring-hydroxylating oxygenase subunit alpha n=1 Tax=Candidatus Poriferisocius sp. TaxID=3101276 RepID=UPI003B58D5A8